MKDGGESKRWRDGVGRAGKKKGEKSECVRFRVCEKERRGRERGTRGEGVDGWMEGTVGVGLPPSPAWKTEKKRPAARQRATLEGGKRERDRKRKRRAAFI